MKLSVLSLAALAAAQNRPKRKNKANKNKKYSYALQTAKYLNWFRYFLTIFEHIYYQMVAGDRWCFILV